jgi:antitoxin (DNA-binding transcriptional repressor) of toxin-antitoxin stability system
MKNVNISELKSRLSYYLKLIQTGEEVTVLDRGKSIAHLKSIQQSQQILSTKPIKNPKDFWTKWEKTSKSKIEDCGFDVVAFLLEDRSKR